MVFCYLLTVINFFAPGQPGTIRKKINMNNLFDQTFLKYTTFESCSDKESIENIMLMYVVAAQVRSCEISAYICSSLENEITRRIGPAEFHTLRTKSRELAEKYVKLDDSWYNTKPSRTEKKLKDLVKKHANNPKQTNLLTQIKQDETNN